MNRAERRRNARQEKPKTYVLTEDQITKMKNDAVKDAVLALLTIPVVVLHDKFGFGQIRLDRFTHYMYGWLDSVQNGEVSFSELQKIAETEAGFKITRRK